MAESGLVFICMCECEIAVRVGSQNEEMKLFILDPGSQQQDDLSFWSAADHRIAAFYPVLEALGQV